MSVGIDTSISASTVIWRAARENINVTLQALGTDHQEMAEQLQGNERRNCLRRMKTQAKRAQTIGEFCESLDLMQKVLLFRQGPTGVVLMGIVNNHAKRWYDNQAMSTIRGFKK